MTQSGMRIALVIYNIFLPLLFVLYLPVLVYKLVRRGGVTTDYLERFGRYSGAKRDALAGLNHPVWVHAVSVGETVAAVTFIRRWQSRRPELSFVLSTTTTTGQATAAAKLPPSTVLVYCPLDFRGAVRRALAVFRPTMLVIFEVEVWPNLLTQAAARQIPLVLANGRMSDRSAAGYARHRWFFGPLYRRFSAICVQTAADAERIRRVGGADLPITVCSTMKFDQVPDVDGADLSPVLLETFGPGPRTVWLAGSTHPGEEALYLSTYLDLRRRFPGLRLILVPRHHERTAEVERLLQERGITYRLRRPRPGAGVDVGAGPADVLVVNTTGELMSFYAAADLVFVGKSLAGNSGGHNIIEPAIFAKAIVHGAAMQNFRDVSRLFQEHGAAVQVADDADLAPALAALLDDDARRGELGRRARDLVDACRGAIDRTLDRYTPILDRVPSGAGAEVRTEPADTAARLGKDTD